MTPFQTDFIYLCEEWEGKGKGDVQSATPKYSQGTFFDLDRGQKL